MSSIHFRFRSGSRFEPLSFDGHALSLRDFRDSIIEKKKLGKASDFKLEVINSDTMKEYTDDNEMIQKNTSVIVRRVPIYYDKNKQDGENVYENLSIENLTKISDLSSVNAPEKDKLKAVMLQEETINKEEAQPGRTVKIPICFHCQTTGHVIKNCPEIAKHSSVGKEPVHVFLRSTLGLDPSKEDSGMFSYSGDNHLSLPEFLKCPICLQCFKNAVLVPCCGASFCETCIQDHLIDSEFSCHSCSKKLSPDDLVPNLSLRKSATTFLLRKFPKYSSGSTKDRESNNELSNNDMNKIDGGCSPHKDECPPVSQVDVGNDSKPPIGVMNSSSSISIPNIENVVLNNIPIQSMVLATSSLLMNPFLNPLSYAKAVSQPILKMVPVDLPFLTFEFAKRVISYESVLSPKEFSQLKNLLDPGHKNNSSRVSEQSSRETQRRTVGRGYNRKRTRTRSRDLMINRKRSYRGSRSPNRDYRRSPKHPRIKCDNPKTEPAIPATPQSVNADVPRLPETANKDSPRKQRSRSPRRRSPRSRHRSSRSSRSPYRHSRRR